jgi:hypothetical protein
VGHQFSTPAETRGFEDHTGFNAAEGAALKAFQDRFLAGRWGDKYVKATGLYDVPTKLAVIRVQHHARFEMNGRLDERTWNYAQRVVP